MNTYTRLFSARGVLALSMMLLPLVAACDKDGGTAKTDDTDDTDGITDTGTLADTIPTVLSNDPLDGAAGVALNDSIRVTFSEDMSASSLDSAFALATLDSGVSVAGTVITTGATAVFWPTTHLSSDTEYVASVSTVATSSRSIALDLEHSWTFTTGTEVMPGQPVDLGTAGNFVILAKSGISTVPISAVTGDMAVSPAAATYITGFSLTSDATDSFSTSTQVTGRVYAADDAAPTPSRLTTAVSDMELAFTDAAGRAPDVTELGAGNIGGMTLDAGVYKWGTGLLIPTDLTLNGSGSDVWIFQIAQDLTVSNGVSVLLTGGAVPENVFWQVAGLVDFGTTSHGEGIVASQTSISLHTGASVNGRLLAQTAVDLDASTVVEPAM